MKKVLFATTALVLSAGFAAADVKLSGDGRMGVQYNGDDWNFSSRARVKFNLSGQTDNGLAFGGAFRADQNDGAKRGSSGSVFISGAFGKLEMGDTVGAPEALFGDLPEVGYEDLTSANPTDNAGNVINVAGMQGQGLLENDIPYLTGDSANSTTAAYNPALLYTYSTGPWSIAASMSDGNYMNNENAYGKSVDDAQEYAVAVAYTYDAYTFGAAYEMVDAKDVDASRDALYDFRDRNGVNGKAGQGTLAASGTFGNTALQAYYAWGNQNNPVDQAYGLGFASKFDAVTVLGYVQQVKLADTVSFYPNQDKATWWGLGASYDLGGGAALKGGISDNDLANTDMTADFGVTFKF